MTKSEQIELRRDVARLMRGIGRNLGEVSSALMKSEITAVLARAVPLAGAYPIPEFPTKPKTSIKRGNALDLAWAIRCRKHDPACHGAWLPVAVFEVDGEDIDVVGKKLPVFARVRPAESIVRAHVLFRIGEDDGWWIDRKKKKKRVDRSKARSKLEDVQRARNADPREWLRTGLEVILDAELEERLPGWIQRARTLAKALVDGGKAVGLD